MTYCTTDEVYATAGITSTDTATATVDEFILQAQGIVDRLTNTTYWNLDNSGTASAGAATTLTDGTKTYVVDAYTDMYLWITGGTGIGQIRKITSNTSTVITVTAAWTTNPDSTSQYRVNSTGTDPYIYQELRDGDNNDTLFLDKYPLILLEAVESNAVTITPSNIYQYPKQGKLVLNTNAGVSYWTAKKAQLNKFDYYFGVYPLPYDVKRYVIISAAIEALSAQMGGTHNVPSTYGMPEASLSIGQAYINIKTTRDTLVNEQAKIEERMIKYASFA